MRSRGLWRLTSSRSRTATRVVDSKELLGIVVLYAGSEGDNGNGECSWLSVEKIGRALSSYFQQLASTEQWPDAAALSYFPPLFILDAGPQTPKRKRQQSMEYASPYTRGRNIEHRGAVAVE